MNVSQIGAIILRLLIKYKDTFTIITKSQDNLGIEGENIKNIISPYNGGYILIRWNK